MRRNEVEAHFFYPREEETGRQKRERSTARKAKEKTKKKKEN